MSCLAAGFQLEPQIAFVRGDDLQACRLSDDDEVCAQTVLCRQARSALPAFLVHETQKEDFSFFRTSWATCYCQQCRQHDGHAAFGITSAASINAPAL